jgi:RimJ/RimL family protein N-acetyltransferase
MKIMVNYFLREIARADLAAINAWRADRELVGLLGAPFRYIGLEVDTAWFEHYLKSRGDSIRLAICRSDDGAIVGVVNLMQIDWVNRSAELSIQVGEASQRGMGAGEQAMRTAIRHAFEDLNFHRLHLTVLSNNERAISLYKKVGFKIEGCLRQALFKNGAYVDVLAMGLLVGDLDNLIGKLDDHGHETNS